MKKLLILIIFLPTLCISQELDIPSYENEEMLVEFTDELIESPSNIFNFMEGNDIINCNEYINLLRKSDVHLIDFIIDIMFLRCENHQFFASEVANFAGEEYDKIVMVHYVKNLESENKELETFMFGLRDDNIYFRGIYEGID